MKRSRNRRRHGFTLMEVLLVLVILVILGSLVGISISQVQKGALRRSAKVQIEMLGESLDLFLLEIRRYPTTEEGLQALIAPPNGDKSFLKEKEVPLDPWDNEYSYELVDEDTYRIWSNGPDMVSDSDDDIASDVAER